MSSSDRLFVHQFCTAGGRSVPRIRPICTRPRTKQAKIAATRRPETWGRRWKLKVSGRWLAVTNVIFGIGRRKKILALGVPSSNFRENGAGPWRCI